MLKIKDIKNSQVFYAMDDNGEPYGFKAWSAPFLVNDVWMVDAEDAGNYLFTFTQEDESILFLTDSLED